MHYHSHRRFVDCNHARITYNLLYPRAPLYLFLKTNISNVITLSHSFDNYVLLFFPINENDLLDIGVLTPHAIEE